MRMIIFKKLKGFVKYSLFFQKKNENSELAFDAYWKSRERCEERDNNKLN